MCGIVAALDKKNDVVQRIFTGLQRLEYRGYDSAGIGTIDKDGEMHRVRSVGKIARLQEHLKKNAPSGRCGIGHTRWATHGGANETNAHPHQAGKVMLVHNGIIENFAAIREQLRGEGINCVSDTDTEVIAQLFNLYLTEGREIEDAFTATLAKLEGAFSLVAIIQGNDHLALAARCGSPLTIGICSDNRNEISVSTPDAIEAVFIASDPSAYADHCQRWAPMDDDHWIVIHDCNITVRKFSGENASLAWRPLDPIYTNYGKGNFRHFMDKEIHEQPEVLTHTLGYYINAETMMPRDFSIARASESDAFKHLASREIQNGFNFNDYDRILLVACGTAWHSGCVARYAFERLARIPTTVELASELRYRQPVIEPRTLAVFISQSGETADTLAAMQYCREHATTLSLVNVETSSLARGSEWVTPLRVGPEIGVASTKAFTGMLCALGGMVLVAAMQRGTAQHEELRRLCRAALSLPRIFSKTISSLTEPMIELSRQIAESNFVLYLGRGHMFPLALEGALKLKEISYIHAQGYAAGELKHGPIALIEDEIPVIALIDNDNLLSKVISNLAEVTARRGWVIAIGPQQAIDAIDIPGGRLTKIAVPDCASMWMPTVLSVPVQMLAYHTALHKGTDVDQPRNLAKSVTVE